MAESELLACPFCGSKPKLIEIPVEVHYYVMCIDCGACGSDLDSKQDAVKAWNTRTAPDTLNLIEQQSMTELLYRLEELRRDVTVYVLATYYGDDEDHKGCDEVAGVTSSASEAWAWRQANECNMFFVFNLTEKEAKEKK